MRSAWPTCALGFLSVLGCATTSHSGGGAAGSDAHGAQAPCPMTSTGFRIHERVRGVEGCPSDIKTRPGPSLGYEVLFGCLDRGAADAIVVVRGQGKKSFRQLLGQAPEDADDPEGLVWRRFAANVRKTALADSVHRAARIRACRSSGYAVELGMHSFRDVDDVISEIGDWLARMDSNGEIMLVIEPRPNPAE